MPRNNFRWPFNLLPWWLLIFIVLVSLPLFLVVSAIRGMREGVASWLSELDEARHG